MRRLLALLLVGSFAFSEQAQVTQPQIAPAPATAPAQATAPAPPFSPNVIISPERENGLYAVGERVRWTVLAPLGMPGARYTYEVRENNLAVLSSGRRSVATPKAPSLALAPARSRAQQLEQQRHRQDRETVNSAAIRIRRDVSIRPPANDACLAPPRPDGHAVE